MNNYQPPHWQLDAVKSMKRTFFPSGLSEARIFLKGGKSIDFAGVYWKIRGFWTTNKQNWLKREKKHFGSETELKYYRQFT